jgi:hypothetical protein
MKLKYTIYPIHTQCAYPGKNYTHTTLICSKVDTKVGWVLEIAPNPQQVSSWYSKLITMVIKKSNAHFKFITMVIKNEIPDIYIYIYIYRLTMVLHFFFGEKKSNMHLKLAGLS